MNCKKRKGIGCKLVFVDGWMKNSEKEEMENLVFVFGEKQSGN